MGYLMIYSRALCFRVLARSSCKVLGFVDASCLLKLLIHRIVLARSIVSLNIVRCSRTRFHNCY
uniref:Uncharacterized protein n=1 Tax=Setaria italica TaxID=4555 RepID=K4ANH0_SETIT